MRVAIVGHNSRYKWDPNSIYTGLTARKEAIVYCFFEFIKRGHICDVYANPPFHSRYHNWFGLTQIDKVTEKYDLILLQDHINVDDFRKYGKTIFYWGFDTDVILNYKSKFPEFDGICLLSRFHLDKMKQNFFNIQKHASDIYVKDHVIPLYPIIPVSITGMGIIPNQFANPQIREPYTVGWFSNYSSELYILLKMWTTILQYVPEAVLNIYNSRENSSMTPSQDNMIYTLIGSTPNVYEHGHVGHYQLADEMMKTSVWACPCDSDIVPESFMNTSIKVQAAGCIPVSTQLGSLKETLHPGCANLKQITDSAELNNFICTLVNALNTQNEYMRNSCKEYAHMFTWKNTVDKFLNLYDDVKI